MHARARTHTRALARPHTQIRRKRRACGCRYLADVFGTKYVGGIHGRLLTAWSIAGVAGPTCLTVLRERATYAAIEDLTAVVSPSAFEQTFGASVGQLPTLIEARTVTISKLMEICPAGTIDPTPSLYNTTMYAMAGLLGVAFVNNMLMRPVAERHWIETQALKAEGDPCKGKT